MLCLSSISRNRNFEGGQEKHLDAPPAAQQPETS
jgi:hypothetical protein